MGVVFDVLVLLILLATLYSMRKIWRVSVFSREYFYWSLKFSVFCLALFALFSACFFGLLSYAYLTADEQMRAEIQGNLHDMGKPGEALDRVLSKILEDS